MTTLSQRLAGSKPDTRANIKTLSVLLALVALASFISGGVFLQPGNLVNLVTQNSALIIVALGQLLVIITGGIDLSVGAVLATSSVMCVLMLDRGPLGAFGAAFLLAALFGLVNGSLVTYVRLPAFVVTLATMQIGYSISKILSDWGGSRGGTVYNGPGGAEIPASFSELYNATLLGVPYPLFLCVGILLLGALFLRGRTGFFFHAVGGNERTARLAGAPAVWVKLCAYTISALLACAGGILFVARVGLGDPQAGTWLALDSIAAVSIGGASLSGGMGTITGTFIGVVILSVLNNLMNLMGVPPTLQPAVKGMVILAAVYLNSARERR